MALAHLAAPLLAAAAVAALAALTVACLGKKNKTVKTGRSNAELKIDDTPTSLNKTQESHRDKPERQLEREELKAALAQSRIQRPPKEYRKKTRVNRVSGSSSHNQSHTARRTPGTPSSDRRTSDKRSSVTGKKEPKGGVLHRLSSHRLPKMVNARKRKEEEKKPIRKRLDLSDEDSSSETSEAVRHRMTFPPDPYNPRGISPYVAPDGRVIAPKIAPLSGKEEQIAIRREFRRTTEYPTMEDVKSMWDSIEDKEEGGGGKKKQKPTPRSSDTPLTSQSQKTSDEVKGGGGVGQGVGEAPHEIPKSSAEAEFC